MKKIKILALAMVFAIMLMGVGYAAWTDYTEVTSTISTGDLDVNVRWANISNPEYTTASITGGQNDNEDENVINVAVSNLYPTIYKANGEGAGNTFVRIHFSVENQGTVPVKLDNVEFTPVDETSPVWDYLKTVIHIHKGIPSATGTSLGTQVSLTGTNPIGSHTTTNPKYLKDMKALLEGCDLATTVLMPGEAIWFGGNTEDESSIRFFLDESAPDTTQNENIGFTLKLNWKQANM